MGKRIIMKKGDTYGNLTIISDAPIQYTRISPSTNKKTHKIRWKCKCECGNISEVMGTKLRSGERTCCSDCAYKRRPQSTLRFTNEERMFKLSIVSRCKNTNGKIQNYLSLEEYTNIIAQNCHYCNDKPKKITHLTSNRIVKRGILLANGVDRLDSSKHYSVDNCVPCCKKCNMAKRDLSKKEFLEHIEKIYKHNNNGNNPSL